MIAYVQRNSISVAEQAIRQDLGLDKKTMGWVMSSFFLTYALLQLPTGWLGYLWGTRKAMTFFASLFSAAAGLFALAAGFPLLAGSRLLMGAAQSGIFPCAVNSIAAWLPDRQRSLASGMLGSFMSVGGAVGAALTGLLLPVIGWRAVFALFALPGFLLAGWFFLYFRDRPEEDSAVNKEDPKLIGSGLETAAPLPTTDSSPAVSPDDPGSPSSDSESQRTPWGKMLRSVPVLALCGQQFFRAIGYIFFATWFATYLRETRGVQDLEAGLLNSLPLLATVAGSPLGGAFSDWIFVKTGSRRWSRQGVALLSMLSCFGLIAVSSFVSAAWPAVLLISAGAFLASAGGPCAYTATIDMGGRHVTMVFSLMNMAGNVGAFLFPLVVPYLLNESPSRPGSGNWNLVLWTFAGMYLAAAFCWLLANPERTIDETADGAFD